MDKTTQTNLCKGIRACGLPRALSLNILNVIQKWETNNGAEWTVERLKAYKQWYETCLAGSPQPPAYFRKTKEGYPTGCFGQLFKVKNQAKVLAVLSAGTVFQAKPDEILPAQREKFVTALKGDHQERRVDARDLDTIRNIMRPYADNRPKVTPIFPDVTLPTPDSITGMSIPIAGGETIRLPSDENWLWDTEDGRRPKRKAKPKPGEPEPRVIHEGRTHEATIALYRSWECIPQAVIEYLDRIDHLDFIPENFSDIGQSPRKRATGNPVGRIGFIQEPQFKMRSIGNPNRVSQHFTLPLAQFWDITLRYIASDCVMDQQAGCRWVQEKLRAGKTLACTDLSSATDLLDLECCLELAKYWSMDFLRDRESVYRYDEAIRYFRALSRGEWETPSYSDLGVVRWEQGQPLGLYPSIRLLRITNNALGMLAAREVHEDIRDSFRTVGDDFCGIEELAEAYTRRVLALGGKINPSKTIVSDKVAEFAGRVITPDRIMLKTIKYKAPSDDSFMSIVSDLGAQAKRLLKPRQRKAWETFKYVPGIAYDGPWSQDSFGQPLVSRVAWTESTSLVDKAPDPDDQLLNLEHLLIGGAHETAERRNVTVEEVLRDFPWPIDDDFQSSYCSGASKPKGGDPRRVDGLSTLERLEKVKSQTGFLSYPEFQSRFVTGKDEGQDADSSATPVGKPVDVSASTSTPVVVQEREDGMNDTDVPDDTAASGVQQTVEPVKGPPESTEGSKPPVVAPPTIDVPRHHGAFARAMAQQARRKIAESHLESEQPQNPDMPT